MRGIIVSEFVTLDGVMEDISYRSSSALHGLADARRQALICGDKE